MRSGIMYRGYVGISLEEALIAYKKKTGHEPTAAVAKPDMFVSLDIPILVRSRKCIPGGFLITHMAIPADLVNDDPSGEAEISTYHFRPKGVSFPIGNGESQEPVKETKKFSSGSFASKKTETVCPYCHTAIKDYNDLGIWWGWKYGVRPPYWEDLRLFVFKRDGHKCQRCHERFNSDELRCHHVNPKESGGSDSARNLLTLCKTCHHDEHPEYPEEDDTVDLPDFILKNLSEHTHQTDTNGVSDDTHKDH